ncbi:putative diacylglycerol O-acyltransferase [compost metagenome]
MLPKLAVNSLRGIARSVLTAEGGAPRTRFNTNVSASRVWDSVTLDLAVVKQIKNLVPGATVNDAVLALIGGAMRRYLQAHDELPEKSLVTLAPVNTRQGNEASASGNTISIVSFPLRTDIEEPIARLEAVHKATSESKAMQSAVGAHDLTNLQKSVPPATLGLAGRLATLMGVGGKGPVVLHNCLVTNVPGPNVPLYMLGAKLVYWCGVAPISDGLSLIWNPASYCGKMFISLTSSPNVVPDPGFLAQCLKDSYEEMQALTIQAETRKAAKGGRAAGKSAAQKASGKLEP